MLNIIFMNDIKSKEQKHVDKAAPNKDTNAQVLPVSIEWRMM